MRKKLDARQNFPEIFFVKMAAAMMQRTYCVLRSFRSPGKVLACRGKVKSARKTVQVTEGPRDYVYFLHNHVVPLYSFEEAIDKLKTHSVAEGKNPEQTVTMCVKCQGLDKEIPSFRGTLLLPRPFGITKKVLVFAEGDEAKAAADAGAEIVGGEELFPQVENNELEFDHCLASLDMAEKIKHLQKVLREKMPHTRRGSVTDDLANAIQAFKDTRVYKTDKYGYVNTAIGMLSFSLEDLHLNAAVVIDAVLKNRRTNKGEFIRKISVTSTQGPGFRLYHEKLVPSSKMRSKH
ncbi:uncharacterized protein LOC114525215 [Dendronephthya gigantea]|uniref:uncharacterized protein LOC114525215 n=1 Tax=Dendronephthya gigantea TaxID=151771 RepID=UPI00106AFFAF|nr:uncharacterized protein LOC114525215 [Dendronephthya gigantea]